MMKRDVPRILAAFDRAADTNPNLAVTAKRAKAVFEKAVAPTIGRFYPGARDCDKYVSDFLTTIDMVPAGPTVRAPVRRPMVGRRRITGEISGTREAMAPMAPPTPQQTPQEQAVVVRTVGPDGRPMQMILINGVAYPVAGTAQAGEVSRRL